MAEESKPSVVLIGPEEIQKINTWIAKHRGNRPLLCPVCESHEWIACDRIFQINQFAYGAMVFDGVVYPLVSLACKVCSHHIFFNAISIGLLEPPTEKKDGG